MEEHSSIGLVVTTDGTVTDIPREDYVASERKAILDMRATGKPYLVIVNSRNPAGEAAQNVKNEIYQEYGVIPVTVDCQSLDAGQIGGLLKALLYTFPMTQLKIYLPRWMDALESEHPVKQALYQALLSKAESIENLGQAELALADLRSLEAVQDYSLRSIDLSNGTVCCMLIFRESLFYEILSNKAGIVIRNDAQLLSLLSELSQVKHEYDKISDALSSVKATGYGVVMPTAEEMKLETPELVRKAGAYGVKLKAGAPSIHMVRVDIDTQISPMVGDEKQSQDLIAYLSGEAPEKLWQSNIFGKSVYDMIQEGLTAKIIRMPEDVRGKFRGTLTRIVNEGATGLICLIL
jgi:stage IV sporulation protein A